MKAVALSRIANAFAEAGKLERAAELLSESLLVIKRAEDDQGLDDDLMFEMVRGERRFDFNSFPLREEIRKGALARLVEAAAHALAGDDDVAVHDSDASIAELADELTRAGQKESALAVLAEATGPDEKPAPYVLHFERAETLAALGAAYARLGEKARAAAYFRRALQLAESQKDFDGEQRLRVLIEVGARYAEAGLAPDARARKSLNSLVRKVEADKE